MDNGAIELLTLVLDTDNLILAKLDLNTELVSSSNSSRSPLTIRTSNSELTSRRSRLKVIFTEIELVTKLGATNASMSTSRARGMSCAGCFRK